MAGFDEIRNPTLFRQLRCRELFALVQREEIWIVHLYEQA